ncbi:RrF2 family transcriptional regulator [Namhaeicola litoreus]|uniref:RrF2 family transcriptional regulator n=2 Tax=Namhaeicola litoreus TaxID=1052145 RepID=A0ABW3Y096_9FLAO
MLSNECKYGIRAVAYLVDLSHLNKHVGSKEMAEHLDIPAPFLAKILQKLSRGNVISSAKGPGGGFFLKDENMTRTLIDIVNCIDGPGVFEKCFLGLPVCNDKNPCAVHHLVVNFRNTIRDHFQTKTFADFPYLDKGM